MDSPERAASHRAPLRTALADRPWFGSAGRWLYAALTRRP
jgi:hypothetical protein